MEAVLKRSSLKVVVFAMVASLLLVSCGTSGTQARGTKVDLTDKKVEITYFDAKTEMQVNSVTTDFYPESGKVLSDPKKDGKQFVRVDLTFKNTGTEKFKVNYTQVSLDGATAKGETQTSLINAGNSTDRLATKELAAGEAVTGAVYFEMPAADTKDTLSVGYKGYDKESKVYSVELK